MSDVTTDKRPLVCVRVLIRNPDGSESFLVGRIRGGLSDGLLAPPGGKLEYGESVYRAAAREVLEETGLDVNVVTADPHGRPELFTTVWVHGDDYGVTLWLVADVFDTKLRKQEPVNREPDKCGGWEWLSLDDAVKAVRLDWKQENWLPTRQMQHYRHLLFTPARHGTVVDHAQRSAADLAWQSYDFDRMEVKDYDNGWVRTEDAGLRRTFYAVTSCGTHSRRMRFEVRFAGPTSAEVSECLVY